MRIATIGLPLALTCAALFGCAQPGNPEKAHETKAAEANEEADGIDVRDIAGQAKVSLVDAIRAAHAAHGGRVVEAELEGERKDGADSVFYEVMIVDGSAVFEVKLDPASGKVISVESEKDPEEIAELTAVSAAATAGTKGLGDYVVGAESGHPGTRAVKAGFEVEGGKFGCEVELLNGRELVEVDVDPMHPDAMKAKAKHSEKEDEEDEDEDDEEGEEEEMGKK